MLFNTLGKFYQNASLHSSILPFIQAFLFALLAMATERNELQAGLYCLIALKGQDRKPGLQASSL